MEPGIADLHAPAPRRSVRPTLLLPEQIAHTDGAGPVVDVSGQQGRLLVLTLAIHSVLEQQRLTVSVWGASDPDQWGPLVSFPHKYYCGMYSTLLNLARYPTVRYLRVQGQMARWAKADKTPMFGFSVFAEASGSRISSAVA